MWVFDAYHENCLMLLSNPVQRELAFLTLGHTGSSNDAFPSLFEKGIFPYVIWFVLQETGSPLAFFKVCFHITQSKCLGDA